MLQWFDSSSGQSSMSIYQEHNFIDWFVTVEILFIIVWSFTHSFKYHGGRRLLKISYLPDPQGWNKYLDQSIAQRGTLICLIWEFHLWWVYFFFRNNNGSVFTITWSQMVSELEILPPRKKNSKNQPTYFCPLGQICKFLNNCFIIFM